jgi:methionyl-tRNA synthetase
MTLPNRYITTTLPYVNDVPHIGHALEFVQADALARYWRLMGHRVFFSVGTDEHGQKVAEKADALGKDRQAYVDEYAKSFQALRELLDLSYDNFIRTSDEQHKAAAQEIWRRCNANGDIYKKTYQGLYCVGDEMFLKESDLVDGRCPNHPTQEPIEVKEENYFFKLSNYQDQLLAYFEKEASIVPEWQRQWAIDFVKGGLDDLSISRRKERMDWGVPVPGDDEHVMYVWFDALTNYISTLGWPEEGGNFNTFWQQGETYQLAGKDQVRFQSIIWQAMLLSAGIKPTEKVLYHGFINSGGQKMSKSIGNVISPHELVERYGTEATRYILLRHVHPFDDSDITWEKMDEWYTANLVNGIGNLTARIMKMAETHLEPEDFPPLDPANLDVPDMVAFQPAMDHIWVLIQRLDERITETEPFKLIKTDEAAAKVIIGELRAELLHIGRLLLPSMPKTSTIIRQAVRANKKPDNLFARLD